MDANEITRHHDPRPDENPWVHGKPPIENIEVVQYDQNWPILFRQLERGIRTTLNETALGIEHVGSTAVPGLAAKPVIDIDLTVADSSNEPSYVPQLEKLGYDLCVREPSWHEHRCFRLAEPRVNLHVFSPDCPEAIRHIMFREWLKSHSDDRKLYERAKLESLPGAKYVTEYNARKQPVIREIYERMFRAAGLNTMFKKAAPNDIPSLKTLARSVIRHNYTPFLGEEAVESFRGGGASDAEIEKGFERCVILAENGDIIGFAITDNDILHLIMIAVEHQNNGYGARLLAHIEKQMFSGFDSIRLQSFADNHATNEFYRKHGWTLANKQPQDDSPIRVLYFEKRRG